MSIVTDFKPPADMPDRLASIDSFDGSFGELLALPTGPVSTLTGSSLLFSAPHEAEQVREGVVKVAEAGTGPLAFALARQVSGSALCTLPGQLGDPNWDADHPYVKAALGMSPRIALDLHMMRPRGFEVCLGLGPYRRDVGPVWQVLADRFLDAGLRVSLNYPFAAGSQTVTGKLQAEGVLAVQVEMSFECYDPTCGEYAASRSALLLSAQDLLASLQ